MTDSLSQEGSQRKQVVLFFAAVFCMSAGIGIHDSLFNNFLSETFSLSATHRGWLELPRETPGFLVFVTAGLLAALPVTRVGTVGALTLTLGMVGMAFLGCSFPLMIAAMLMGSTGMHLLQPVGSSVAIALTDEKNRGRRMGEMGAFDTVGVVMGTGFVFLLFDRVNPEYRAGFLCVALMTGISGLLYSRMHVPSLHKPRARMVMRKKYWLYYCLELIFGARKQIFITFGPWVLIKVYGTPATSMAGLLMTAALIGIFFKPLVGVAIDRFGEKTIMILDGMTLVLVCLGYGYAQALLSDPVQARWLACGCYIADNLLFALGSARAIYLSRIAESPQDLNSTLAMGVSVNHVVSMTIPVVAGAIWAGFGYERVFLAAAGLALVQGCFALLVPAKKRPL